ncbi:putative MEMO1 family protein [Plasmopara halstedii]
MSKKPEPSSVRVRLATHAGSWYSHDEHELDNELKGWLDIAKTNYTETQHGSIRALIGPHAGLRYSGSTAAYAYHHLLHLDRIKRVFILGPSHHFYLRGCAVSTAHEYETPLGNIPIDREVNEKLVDSGKFATMSMDVDEDEHSIELHLPFIYKVLQNRKFTIVPILVGNTKTKIDEEYGKILAPYFENDENLFVISSDFCHWGPRFRYQPHDSTYGEIHEFIKYLDHQGMEFIERLDPDGFTTYLNETKNTICGRHPISLLLQTILASTKLKCSLKFVKYAQSSACMRHGDSSVSYASAIVYSEP